MADLNQAIERLERNMADTQTKMDFLERQRMLLNNRLTNCPNLEEYSRIFAEKSENKKKLSNLQKRRSYQRKRLNQLRQQQQQQRDRETTIVVSANVTVNVFQVTVRPASEQQPSGFGANNAAAPPLSNSSNESDNRNNISSGCV